MHTPSSSAPRPGRAYSGLVLLSIVTVFLSECAIQASPKPVAAVSPAVRRAMEVEYWREQHAFQKGYIGVIDSQLAPDYSAVLDTGQKVTRVQVLTMDRQTMDLFGRELRMTVHIDSLTGSDSKVEVLVTETVSGTVMNRDGRTQSLTSSDLSKDLWVHVGSLWKLKRSRLVKSTALIDGRPIRTAKK